MKIALSLYPTQVIAENVNKLNSRYHSGTFDPQHKNRKDGDL
jgi:hypothetical protein